MESGLSISKMYDLYVDSNEVDPVKESFYRYIFRTEYNIDFHQPKKDRCEKCEEYKVAKENGFATNEMINKYNDHLLEKRLMRADTGGR